TGIPTTGPQPDRYPGRTRPVVDWTTTPVGHRGEGPAMVGAIDDLLVEALFVSYVQRSDSPTAEAVHRAITEATVRYGTAPSPAQPDAQATVAPRSRAYPATHRASAVLPMPGSPVSTTNPPDPASAAATPSARVARTSARPISTKPPRQIVSAETILAGMV